MAQWKTLSMVATGSPLTICTSTPYHTLMHDQHEEPPYLCARQTSSTCPLAPARLNGANCLIHVFSDPCMAWSTQPFFGIAHLYEGLAPWNYKNYFECQCTSNVIPSISAQKMKLASHASHVRQLQGHKHRIMSGQQCVIPKITY